MCLDYKTKKGRVFPKLTIQKGVIQAYKIFKIEGTTLRFPIYGGHHIVPRNKWIDELGVRSKFQRNTQTSHIACEISKGHYKPGFHSFVSKEDARHSWMYDNYENARVIVPVYVRKLIEKGWQDGCPVLVTQELYVPWT